MKYKPARDLPKFAREYHTLSPTELQAIILKERNRDLQPEAIIMWFHRHPDIYEQLKNEILQEELPEIEISETIFNNGNFKELPSVKNWRLELDARELDDAYTTQKFNNLRNACLGKSHGFNFVEEGKYCLKHPDRLTLKDAMLFISLLKGKGKDAYYFKRDLKDFLESKGIVVGKKFAVGKPKGYGKYAKLFIEKDIVNKMLEWIKQQNFEVYVVDFFMFKNGTRITATLNALIENLKVVGEEAIITVYDKGRRSKYPHGHPWDKRVDSTLLHDLRMLIGDRTLGNIFTVTASDVGKLNREALELYAPKILKRFPHLKINHLWRHLFFQYILRQCNWNYTIAGALGGATPQSVEESYGKPPEQTLKEWREKFNIEI